MSDVKKIIFCVCLSLAFFAAGLLTGYFGAHLSYRSGVSKSDEYHNAIKSELAGADEARIGIESGVTNARSNIERSIEQSAIIGNGIDGIEKRASENTELLDRAIRILCEAGERKQEFTNKQ